MSREALDEFDVKSLIEEEVKLSKKIEIFQEKSIEIAKTFLSNREISHHQGCIGGMKIVQSQKRIP